MAQNVAVHASHAGLFGLTGKTIAITGAARGLGITLAQAVLEAGGHAACMDILPAPEADTWLELQTLAKASNLTLTYRRVDITDEPTLSAAMDEINADAAKAGAPFYGAIACAGIQQLTLAIDYTVPDFERMMRVNILGTFLTAKHTARILMKNGTPGSIVLIASMSGHKANRGLFCSAYNTSKAGVQQMGRSLAQEWGQFGIRVNTLSPGYIITNMTDVLLEEEPGLKTFWMAGALLGRLGAPEDFKAPTIYMLSPGSGYMTGADLRVDGGHCAAN